MDWDSGEPMRVTGVDVSGVVFLNIFKKDLTKWSTFQWFLIVVHKFITWVSSCFSGEYQFSILFCSLTAYFWCVNPHVSWTKPQFWFVFHDQTAKHHDHVETHILHLQITWNPLNSPFSMLKPSIQRTPRGQLPTPPAAGLAGLAPQRPGICWAP